MPNEPARARRPVEARGEEEGVDSFFEVPAAVLCAFCGQSDCPGCIVADEGASGVIAIVPWERPGSGAWTRLWATANATTHGAEAFFSALPDGEIPPAMRFAVLAETLAVASMMVLILPLAAIAFPAFAAQLIESPALRGTVLRWIAVGVPALSLWMIAMHVTHGAALDAGARRQGAKGQRRRAVRFGLYACGWDLMATPIGALVSISGRGRKAVRSVLDASAGVVGRSTEALLQGVYQLSPEATARARRSGIVAAMIITLVSATFVVGLATAAILGGP